MARRQGPARVYGREAISAFRILSPKSPWPRKAHPHSAREPLGETTAVQFQGVRCGRAGAAIVSIQPSSKHPSMPHARFGRWGLLQVRKEAEVARRAAEAVRN